MQSWRKWLINKMNVNHHVLSDGEDSDHEINEDSKVTSETTAYSVIQQDLNLADLIILIKNINTSTDLKLPNILIIEILNWGDVSPNHTEITESNHQLNGSNNQNDLYLQAEVSEQKYFSIHSIKYRFV
jgi:hypothetical protein